MSKILTIIGSIIVLFLMPLACSTLLADGVDAPKLALLELGSAIMVAAVFWQLWNRRSWCWPSHPLLHTSLAFFVWGIICSLVNGAHTYSLPAIITAFCCAVLTTVWSTYGRREWLWRGAGLISLVVFITGLYAHLQRLSLANWYIGSVHIGDFMNWRPVHLAWERTIATMGNPNYFATYLVGALPLALVWALSQTKSYQRWLAVLLWVSSAVAMILTQTRSAWLAAVVATPLFAWSMWRSTPAPQRKRRFLICGAILIATLLSTQLTFSWQKQLHPQLDLNERLTNFADQKDMSIQARYYFWHTALNSALIHPVFGCGAGGHEVRAMQDRQLEPLPLRFPMHQMENVHSQPLETLAESGWIGLALLLASFFLFAKVLVNKRDMLSAGLLSSAVALWCSQMFICANTPCWSLWAFYLAAAVCIGRESSSSSDISMSNSSMSDTIMSDMSDEIDTGTTDITSSNSSAVAGNDPSAADNSPSVAGNGSAATGNSSAVAGNDPSAADNDPSVAGNGSAGSDNGSTVAGNDPAAADNDPSAAGNGSAGSDNGSAGSGDVPAAAGNGQAAADNGSTVAGNGPAAADNNPSAAGNGPAGSGDVPAVNKAYAPPSTAHTVLGALVVAIALAAVTISTVMNVRCEYDIDRGRAAHGDAGILLTKYRDVARARDLYMLSEQYYMRALREAPLWRQAMIYRSLGNAVKGMYVYFGNSSDEALYDSARECYESALLFNDCEPFTYSCLADLQGRNYQHVPQALDSIAGALNIDPLNPQYLNQKAFFLICLGRYAEAREVAKRALEHCPISPDLWRTLAIAHRHTGEYELAERDLEMLLRLTPQARDEADNIRKIKCQETGKST